MASRRVPVVDMAAVNAGDSVATAVALAACASRWFSMAGTHISFRNQPSHVAVLEGTAKAGLLAAAMDLRDLLAQSPDGRQALRDFGFEPLLQNVEGE